MSGRSCGHARVSTDDQDLALPLEARFHHGIPASRIFREILSVLRTPRARIPIRGVSRPRSVVAARLTFVRDFT